MKIDDWYVNPEMDDYEAERRLRAAQDWVNGVDEVTRLSTNEKAQELFAKFFQGVAVMAPALGNTVIPVRGPEVPTIFFVPLFSDDTDINETTAFMLNQQTANAARFTENIPGRIYFNAEIPVSSKARGLLLLHEAMHAYFFESKEFRSGNELDHWYEEVAANELELDVLTSICGAAYTQAFGANLRNFTKHYHETRGSFIPQADMDIGPMEAALGPAESEREFGLRQALMWQQTIYRMFDNLFGDEAAINKALFTRQLYSASGTA